MKNIYTSFLVLIPILMLIISCSEEKTDNKIKPKSSEIIFETATTKELEKYFLKDVDEFENDTSFSSKKTFVKPLSDAVKNFGMYLDYTTKNEMFFFKIFVDEYLIDDNADVRLKTVDGNIKKFTARVYRTSGLSLISYWINTEKKYLSFLELLQLQDSVLIRIETFKDRNIDGIIYEKELKKLNVFHEFLLKRNFSYYKLY